jgi:hypothetical protein
MSQAVKGDNEEAKVVKLDDNSMSEGDPKDQTRQPFLVRLLLALAGIKVLKQGLSDYGCGLGTSVNLGLSVYIFFFSNLMWLFSLSFFVFFLNR